MSCQVTMIDPSYQTRRSLYIFLRRNFQTPLSCESRDAPHRDEPCDVRGNEQCGSPPRNVGVVSDAQVRLHGRVDHHEVVRQRHDNATTKTCRGSRPRQSLRRTRHAKKYRALITSVEPMRNDDSDSSTIRYQNSASMRISYAMEYPHSDSNRDKPFGHHGLKAHCSTLLSYGGVRSEGLEPSTF